MTSLGSALPSLSASVATVAVIVAAIDGPGGGAAARKPKAGATTRPTRTSDRAASDPTVAQTWVPGSTSSASTQTTRVTRRREPAESKVMQGSFTHAGPRAKTRGA